MTEEINYICAQCKRGNCKLWRTTSVFLVHITLKCIKCIEKEDFRAATIDADGLIKSHATSDHRTDQVGGMVPAVLVPDRSTFWGYTSVPEQGVRWWTALPNY